MTVRSVLGRLDDARLWLVKHPGWLISIMFFGMAFSIVDSYESSRGQAQRATHAAQHATHDLTIDYNKIVCLFRSLVIPGEAAAKQTANDQTQSESARARAVATVARDERIKGQLVTVPIDYVCPLPKS